MYDINKKDEDERLCRYS